MGLESLKNSLAILLQHDMVFSYPAFLGVRHFSTDRLPNEIAYKTNQVLIKCVRNRCNRIVLHSKSKPLNFGFGFIKKKVVSLTAYTPYIIMIDQKNKNHLSFCSINLQNFNIIQLSTQHFILILLHLRILKTFYYTVNCVCQINIIINRQGVIMPFKTLQEINIQEINIFSTYN